MPKNLTEPTRAYIYRVALAVLALLVIYGVVSAGAPVNGWAELITAVLGIGSAGLATANTSTKPAPAPEPEPEPEPEPVLVPGGAKFDQIP